MGSLDALLELSARHEAEGDGRRAVAAQLRQAGGRAAAGPAVAQAAAPTRSTRAAARTAGRRRRSPRRARRRWRRATRTPACRPSGRARGRRRPGGAGRASRSSRWPRRRRRRRCYEGLERWKARHPEAAAHLEPADVLVDGDARPLLRLVPAPGQPDPRPGGGPAAPGAARPRLRPVGRLRVAGPLASSSGHHGSGPDATRRSRPDHRPTIRARADSPRGRPIWHPSSIRRCRRPRRARQPASLYRASSGLRVLGPACRWSAPADVRSGRRSPGACRTSRVHPPRAADRVHDPQVLGAAIGVLHLGPGPLQLHRARRSARRCCG